MKASFLESLKTALVDADLVSTEQFEEAESEARRLRADLRNVLVDHEVISREDLERVVAEKLEHADLQGYAIDSRVLDFVPQKLARRLGVMPLFLSGGVLTVASADPFDLTAAEEIASATGRAVETVLASRDDIHAAIDEWYSVGEERQRLIERLAGDVRHIERECRLSDYDDSAVTRIVSAVEKQKVAEFFHRILVEAVIEDASDVHVETGRDRVVVRFRVDRVLSHRLDVPPDLAEPLVSHIKMQAGLNLHRRKVPQEGWFAVEIRNRHVDLHLTTFPSLRGENLVLHLSDRDRLMPGLTALGLGEGECRTIQRAMQSTKGLMLVSGPDGSGRSTTAYAMLRELVGERKIMTVEDPIKYELDDIVQGQVDIESGFSFNRAIRAAMTHDPDVVYTSHVLDADVAQHLIQCALGGQLVIARLHASNAFEAFSRLVDMKVNAGSLASVLKCSVNQRLVRKICVNCRDEYEPGHQILDTLGLDAGTVFYRGKGCAFCFETGYRGLVGVFEILLINRELRQLITSNAPDEELMETAWSYGMKSLFEAGVQKVVRGSTTIDELRRVIGHHFPASVVRSASSARAK